MKTAYKSLIVALLVASTIVISCNQEELVPDSRANEKVEQLVQPESEYSTMGDYFGEQKARIAAAGFCECVRYVKNVTGVQNPVSAKDYGTNLKSKGYFEKVPDFTSSWGNIWATDVVVISNNYGSGVNSTHGHVGFASSLKLVEVKVNGKVTSKYFEVKLKGSNQTNDPNKVFTDAGCNNVDVNMTVKYSQNSSLVKFYRK